MDRLWRLDSYNLTMFVLADSYWKAKDQFKTMLLRYMDHSKKQVVLDEIVEISLIKPNGKEDFLESRIEFTDAWLRDLGVGFRAIKKGAFDIEA